MPRAVVEDPQVTIQREQAYLFREEGNELQEVSWDAAACRGAEPDLFFPISSHDVMTRARALRYCESCAVRLDCLRVALTDPTLVGIWGGTDETERARMRRSQTDRSLAAVG